MSRQPSDQTCSSFWLFSQSPFRSLSQIANYILSFIHGFSSPPSQLSVTFLQHKNGILAFEFEFYPTSPARLQGYHRNEQPFTPQVSLESPICLSPTACRWAVGRSQSKEPLQTRGEHQLLHWDHMASYTATKQTFVVSHNCSITI